MVLPPPQCTWSVSQPSVLPSDGSPIWLMESFIIHPISSGEKLRLRKDPATGIFWPRIPRSLPPRPPRPRAVTHRRRLCLVSYPFPLHQSSRPERMCRRGSGLRANGREQSCCRNKRVRNQALPGARGAPHTGWSGTLRGREAWLRPEWWEGAGPAGYVLGTGRR